jgi:Pyruvate/2-oxoacid:ferredoxin oxidoreductase gamma subunit
MEREVVITGIGGQGIQLMAKILAQAASAEGRFVMLFGIYMGMMRGGPSDSTVVISDDEIAAPPIIPHAWSVVAMHPAGIAPLVAKLRPHGFLLVNSTLVTKFPGRDDIRVAGLPATRIAEEAGNIMGAGIALAAFAEATGVVPGDAPCRDGIPTAAPPASRRRQCSIPRSRSALRARHLAVRVLRMAADTERGV